MKIVSIVLTVLLGLTAGVYFSSFQTWYALRDNKKFDQTMRYDLEKISVIAGICFSLAFVISLILTVKGKYKANCFFFVFCILASIIISMIIHA